MSLTEGLGFVTGAACVYLTLKENIWNFPLGLANNLFFLLLFLHGRLFGDAGLQIIYLILGMEGWHLWLHGGEGRTALLITRSPRHILFVVAAFTVLATAGLTLVFRMVEDAAPFLDSSTTVLSLSAQYLLNRKAIENWFVWLLANAMYIYLYLSRGLQLTAVLYALFGCLCVAGFLTWRRALA